MKKKLFFYLIIAIISFISCNTTDPPVDKAELLLKLEDVSCTEAWITLTINNLQLPAEINLIRTDAAGNSSSHISILTTQDSLLYIDSLLPNQTYLLKATSIEYPVLSSEITVTTMDTTSHNFTFETWTFGDIGSSTLYDVAIINENNIWAVGEINIADTSENGYTMYNAVHWDGNEWELKRITVNFRGFIITPTLEGIFAFSPTQIWLAGGLAIYGDGTNWIPYDVRLITGVDALSTSKAWGSSPDNMYFVGRNGNIAHYNGSQWRKIESGTDLPILDIYGERDLKSGEYEILCVAEEYSTGGKSKILRIENNLVRQVNTDSLLTCCLWGIWFIPNRQYMAVGDGLWQTKLLNGNWVRNKDFPALFKTSIRGDNLNNIVIGGAFWLLAHWNGVSWQTYFPMTSGSFTEVKIKDNIIIAVGGIDTKAAFVLGRRIN